MTHPDRVKSASDTTGSVARFPTRMVAFAVATACRSPVSPAATNASVSDEDLVVDSLGGAEDAFAELYDRYRRPVYSIAARILLNSEEAYDATQEIFIKAYRSLASFDRGRCSFYAWLCRLAANHAIDCWRARRRRAERPFPGDLPKQPAGGPGFCDAIGSPYDDLATREKLAEICRGVDALPELQKKVFVLRYFQNLKLEEIARMERCSLGTVKQSLFRATQTVRRLVKRRRGRA